MTAPLHVAVWAPPLYLPATGLPNVLQLCCRRHAPSQRVPDYELLLASLIFKAFLDLPDVAAAIAGGVSDLLELAAEYPGPLCCAVGDAKMEALHRQIPAVWALRN